MTHPAPLAARRLMDAFRLLYDGPDTAKDWWFTVADEIYWNRPALQVPKSWTYRPSFLGNTNDPDNFATDVIRRAGDAALMRFARAIHRYMRILHQGGAFAETD